MLVVLLSDDALVATDEDLVPGEGRNDLRRTPVERAGKTADSILVLK